MTDLACPICRGKNGTHKMDCQNASYVRQRVEAELANVETIAPKKIHFDLEAGSAEIMFVETEGEEVLKMIPGGHLVALGEPITPGQLEIALRRFLDERFDG